MTIHVQHGGLLTTLQDLGRVGYQKFGVIESGAMDKYSLRIGNLLVGNEETEGALEISLFGTSLRFEQETMIAITGGDLQAELDGEPAPTWRPIVVAAGSELSFKSAVQGCRAYLCAAGGFDVPVVMGSKSTYIAAGLGGFEGRPLQKGDRLACGQMNERNRQLYGKLQSQDMGNSWSVWYRPLVDMAQEQTIRMLKGTEYDWFDEASQAALLESAYTVTSQSDRMGMRLDGAAFSMKEKRELLSEGVTFGTIQVPPNGKPIILMADRQTTGGYPKIGQVITADLPALAQMRPNAVIRFRDVSVEKAQQVLLEKERVMDELRTGITARIQGK